DVLMWNLFSNSRQILRVSVRLTRDRHEAGPGKMKLRRSRMCTGAGSRTAAKTGGRKIPAMQQGTKESATRIVEGITRPRKTIIAASKIAVQVPGKITQVALIIPEDHQAREMAGEIAERAEGHLKI